MELGLSGKTVIITGGGSNIGRSIVRAFADEGSNIVIAELDPAQGQRVADEVAAEGMGSRTIVVATDVTNHESVASMVETATGEFGGVDVLVNNAGWTIDRLFLEKPRHEWEREVQVNLWGAINCIHAVLPGMVERRGGSIVCLSSDAGRMGEYREAVYSACKAGVIALSKSIARETGRYGRAYGLRLNCVARDAQAWWCRRRRNPSARSACGTRCARSLRRRPASAPFAPTPCAAWRRRVR